MAEKYTPPAKLCADPQFTLSNECTKKDSDLAESYAAELIEISGAPINVFRMLGVHEQGRLVDLTGAGNPIAGGTEAGYLLRDAFVDATTEWRSSARGAAVLSTFLGYNFGTKKTSFGTERYASPQPIREKISSIRIQQGANPNNRVTQVRIEKSDDGGLTWTRTAITKLPDTADFELVSFAASQAPAQMWRLVPLQFNGVAMDEPWVVVRLEMMDYEATMLSNIQDPLLLENRDRDYAQQAVPMKAQYDIIDIQSQFSRFGIDIPDQYTFTMSFAKMVEMLGRPLVVGDIIELPAEAQYDQNLNVVRKWMEIEDTGWSSSGFSPNWRPVLFRFTASPLIARQETRDLFGMKSYVDTPDGDFLEGLIPVNTQAQQSSEHIATMSKEAVPETGTDISEYDVADPSLPAAASATFDSTGLYIEDAIPANGEPYGEGYKMPESPKDGEWYRLLYPDALNLPARLFRWSALKNKWVLMEVDRRGTKSSHRPSVQRVLDSTTKVDLR